MPEESGHVERFVRYRVGLPQNGMRREGQLDTGRHWVATTKSAYVYDTKIRAGSLLRLPEPMFWKEYVQWFPGRWVWCPGLPQVLYFQKLCKTLTNTRTRILINRINFIFPLVWFQYFNGHSLKSVSLKKKKVCVFLWRTG